MMTAETYARGVWALALAALLVALLKTLELAMITPNLLLTTPLSMLPLCAFGTLFAIWNVKPYPFYSGMGVLLAVLTAGMI